MSNQKTSGEPFGYWLAPKDQPALGRFHRVTPDDAIIDSDSVVSYFDITPLYAYQPVPVAVTLQQVMSAYEYAESHPHKYLRGTTNWCAAVAWSLTAKRPAHANPPPGAEPSGTHHDNDGLDEMRKP